MSNLAGGLSIARKQFLKDLQDDKDYCEYREDSQSRRYGTASTFEDPFVKTEIFKKLILGREKTLKYQANIQKKIY